MMCTDQRDRIAMGDFVDSLHHRERAHAHGLKDAESPAQCLRRRLSRRTARHTPVEHAPPPLPEPPAQSAAAVCAVEPDEPVFTDQLANWAPLAIMAVAVLLVWQTWPADYSAPAQTLWSSGAVVHPKPSWWETDTLKWVLAGVITVPLMLVTVVPALAAWAFRGVCMCRSH